MVAVSRGCVTKQPRRDGECDAEFKGFPQANTGRQVARITQCKHLEECRHEIN